MLQNIRKQQKGFTIIEVLIVLAIAGLILLIVFLAVPALQRNSRNTQLRNGVSTVLGGINDFVANNGGSMPTTVGTSAGLVTISGGSGTTQTQVRINGSLSAANSGTPEILIRFGQKCSGTSVVSGVTRNVAASFNIETSGSPAPQCTDG